MFLNMTILHKNLLKMIELRILKFTIKDLLWNSVKHNILLLSEMFKEFIKLAAIYLIPIMAIKISAKTIFSCVYYIMKIFQNWSNLKNLIFITIKQFINIFT